MIIRGTNQLRAFKHIEFRDTRAGPMACVKGTGKAVWVIVNEVRQNGGNMRKVARLHAWPETDVRAALQYAASFPEEIDALIEKSPAAEEF